METCHSAMLSVHFLSCFILCSLLLLDQTVLLSPLHFHCFRVTTVCIILLVWPVYMHTTLTLATQMEAACSFGTLVHLYNHMFSQSTRRLSTVLLGVASHHLFPFIWHAPLNHLAVSHQSWLATMILSVGNRTTEMSLKNMEIFLSGISEHHWYFIILALGTSHLTGYLVHSVDRSRRESTWDGVEHMLIYTGISWTFKSIALYLKFRSLMFPSPSLIQSLNSYFVLHQSSVLTLISTALHQDFTPFVVVMLAVLREIRCFWNLWNMFSCHRTLLWDGKSCFIDAVLFLLLLYSDAEYWLVS
jgi:hypothetical protein